jgi:hypothetical protein
VKSGPSVSASDALETDAYDKFEATVPAGGSITVAVVPASSKVQFLLITASDYKHLEYDVTGGASNVKLDAAQLFNGTGAVSLLGAVPGELIFSHSDATAADATVSILVGRGATS